MQIEIWKEEEVKPSKVRLKIANSSYGPQVVAVEADGFTVDYGSLLTIQPDGVRLIPGVNPKLGFPLDRCGRLKLVD